VYSILLFHSGVLSVQSEKALRRGSF
jgi:hypothetical protein